MKLNGVIILNRRHLRDFFSFTEFWNKRNEFKKISNSEIFFKPKDKENMKTQLKAQVINWINHIPLTSDKQLNLTDIILPNGDVKRNYTSQCEKELNQMRKEESFGIVCLYEMMERNLKPDIYEVLACLGYEIFDPESGIIVVQNNHELNLISYNSTDVSKDESLNNVLIVNLSKQQDGESTLIFENIEIKLKPRECVRAIFFGEQCLKVLPSTQGPMRFDLHQDNHTTGLSLNNNSIETKGNVIDFSYGHSGYIYASHNCDEKFISCHCNIHDCSYYYYNPIDKNENIIYIELNNDETKCLLLTNKLNLYLCNKNNDTEIIYVDKNVLKATFKGNEIETIKKH
jgi:hypothetical protein